MSLPGAFSDCKRFWGKLIVNMFLVIKRKSHIIEFIQQC